MNTEPWPKFTGALENIEVSNDMTRALIGAY